MRQFIKVRAHICLWSCVLILLFSVVGRSLPSVAVAQEITVSDQTFGCILDWPKVRNTRFKHSDPEKLKEAMRILRDSVPDKEYPVGTILQLIPFEAMVKHPREKFPEHERLGVFLSGCLQGRDQDRRSRRASGESFSRGHVLKLSSTGREI